MLYRRACEGMAGRPHWWGSRKVEWQGTQRSPNLIRIYNQCSWKALMCWIKPKEPTGTSVSAWLSVWFWQRMESLTRHSVWTPSPLPPILTRDCKIDPAIIFEAPSSVWILKLNLDRVAAETLWNASFQTLLVYRGWNFWGESPCQKSCYATYQCTPDPLPLSPRISMLLFSDDLPMKALCIQLDQHWDSGEGGDAIRTLASKIPPSVRIASQQAAQVWFSVYVCV